MDPVVADKCFPILGVGDEDNSTGHFGEERTSVASSVCLCAGTNQRDLWCKLRRGACLALRRIWLKVLVKACMRRLSSSEMVHHGERRVAKCGPVASEIGGVMELLVYMTQSGGLSACFPMGIVSFFRGYPRRRIQPI